MCVLGASILPLCFYDLATKCSDSVVFFVHFFILFAIKTKPRFGVKYIIGKIFVEKETLVAFI
jgi:hypothetical protein